MTPEEQRLVKESFARVAPIADQAAALFYQNLFSLDPSLRELFKHDMQEQGRRLMTTIGAAVGAVDHIGTIVPAVQELARRHLRYGVRPPHYGTVGAALLQTLEQGLGPAFTPPVRSAWSAFYDLLSTEMIAAAEAEESIATRLAD
jgi:hemoglobin-like flavoprotein